MTDEPTFNSVPLDTTTLIIQYEQGELDSEEIVNLFAELIKSGLAWSLQGHYGRTAMHYISIGVISREGKIDWNAYDAFGFDNA